jgi:hypothetical protein
MKAVLSRIDPSDNGGSEAQFPVEPLVDDAVAGK